MRSAEALSCPSGFSSTLDDRPDRVRAFLTSKSELIEAALTGFLRRLHGGAGGFLCPVRYRLEELVLGAGPREQGRNGGTRSQTSCEDDQRRFLERLARAASCVRNAVAGIAIGFDGALAGC